MQIDVLVHSLQRGGAERVAVNLANGWHEAGHHVRLLIQTPVDAVEYFPLPGIEVVSCTGSGTVQRLIALRNSLLDSSADVVVAIQANVAIEAVLACAGLRQRRIVGCEHSTPVRAVRGRFWRLLRPYAYRRLAAVTTLTEGAAVELRSICPGTEVQVIPNALRLPLARTSPHLEPADFLRPAEQVLLAAGRFVEAKGFDQLVANFAHLSRKNEKARLVILGEGPLQRIVEQQVEALGLSGKVILPGRAGNLGDWYARAALFVMTSRWEGLPLVLMEAMGHGCPAVVTDFQHGPRDVIRHGVDGVIVPEGDQVSWVNAVSELLGDGPRRTEMARHAAEVTQRFSEANVLQMWQRLFDRLDGPGRAGAQDR